VRRRAHLALLALVLVLRLQLLLVLRAVPQAFAGDALLRFDRLGDAAPVFAEATALVAHLLQHLEAHVADASEPPHRLALLFRLLYPPLCRFFLFFCAKRHREICLWVALCHPLVVATVAPASMSPALPPRPKTRHFLFALFRILVPRAFALLVGVFEALLAFQPT